jgi:hypothetical protein
MEIPFTRWYPAIDIRQSRRQYDVSNPLSIETISALERTCAEFRPFPEARVELINETPGKIFDFILGSYGLIRNPAAALAFIGDMRQPQGCPGIHWRRCCTGSYRSGTGDLLGSRILSTCRSSPEIAFSPL